MRPDCWDGVWRAVNTMDAVPDRNLTARRGGAQVAPEALLGVPAWSVTRLREIHGAPVDTLVWLGLRGDFYRWATSCDLGRALSLRVVSVCSMAMLNDPIILDHHETWVVSITDWPGCDSIETHTKIEPKTLSRLNLRQISGHIQQSPLYSSVGLHGVS